MAKMVLFGDFVEEMTTHIKAGTFNNTGSLEEYLRALYSLIQNYREIQPTWDLFAHLLVNALTHTPPPFDEAWFVYTSPPDLDIEEAASVEDDYRYLQHMLLYQIADLHQMKILGVLDSPGIYLGVKSPTGHSWYNFHPEAFLKCGLASMNPAAAIVECNWADLAILLWVCQIYE